MIYEIKWQPQALRDLSKLNNFLAKRIYKKILESQEKGFFKNIKKIKNTDYFRLRVGEYLALLKIDKKIIKIIKVKHRRNIYKNF
jgi:mRNA-degrading endonuclease RelE of RelBE toxin-antitoxin system